MRKKKLAYNTISSVIYQVIVIICGFILPKAILGSFGSEVNGLVNSITQFLSIVSLMDMGVGAVISSTLYKPLAEKDWSQVSRVVSAGRSFFDKIVIGLLVYVFALSIVYPYINNSGFGRFYTVALIIIISANSFSQFYLGVIDSILIGADQKSYISYISNAVSHLANTFFCLVFIKLGFGIHAVKLITAVVYVARPLAVRIYVNKKYPVDRHIKFEKNTLKQKWNAVSQHISECVLDFTDVMVLTFFAMMTDVSVYSVYNLVVYNMKQFFLVATNGTLSLMGNLWACGEKEKLNAFFDKMEFVLHAVVIMVFGCTYVLLVPFVSVYVSGIKDADYIRPLFAFFICLAHAMHCLRLPYFNLLKAANHFRQTQNCFIIGTVMNIVISIALVKWHGLAGVAIGTLIAMTFQTVWLAWYCYRKLLKRPLRIFAKRLITDCICYALIIICTRRLSLTALTYFSWFKMAVVTGIIVLCVSVCVNVIFYQGLAKKYIGGFLDYPRRKNL